MCYNAAMRTAITLHGMPSKEEYFDANVPSPSNHHWLPWVQRQLLLNGVLAQTPEMPVPYAPNYAQWASVFEQFRIDEETMLIGHSCGAGFLIRWLSEHPVRVGKVALVAPWIDPSRERAREMFDDLRMDSGVAARTQGMRLFISSDDLQDKLDTAAILEREIPGIQTNWFIDRGHFTIRGMKTQCFPELVEYLLDSPQALAG